MSPDAVPPPQVSRPTVKTIPAVYWAGLLVLFLFQAWHLNDWLRNDTRPPAWDESHHLRIAIDYRTALAEGQWDKLFRPVYSNYPPLYHLSLAAVMGSPGEGKASEAADRGVRVNLIYWGVLLVSVFLIGSKFHSPAAGLSASVIVSFFGATLFLLRRPMIDVPLAAWVALFYAVLLFSNEFRRPGWGGLLGLIVSAGLLTKWSFAVYAGIPLALYLVREWKENRRATVGYCFLVIGVVAGPWYLFNFVPSILRIAKLSSLREAGDPHVWTLAGWTWYAAGLIKNQIFWPMSIPLALGVWGSFRKKRIELLLWLVVPLVIFSLIRNKDLRYLVPSLPAAAVMSALGSTVFPGAFVRRAWLVGWTAVAIVLGISFSYPGEAPFFWKALALGETPLERDVPRADDWKTDEILKTVKQTEAEGGARVHVIGNHPYFHTGLFRFTAEWNEWHELFLSAPKRNLGDFNDFILWKSGDLGPHYTLGYAVEADRLLKEPPLWLQKTFVVRKTWALPDGSSAVLYGREVQDAPWPGELGEVEIALDHFPLPRFNADGLRVRLRSASAKQARQGTFAEIRIQCDRLDYRGLILENVVIDARDVRVDLFRLLGEKEVHFMSVGKLSPSLEVEARVLEDYLRKKAKWLKDPKVTLQDGHVEVEGKAAGFPVRLEAQPSLSEDKGSLEVSLRSFRVSGLPFPLFLARNFTRKTFSLTSSKDLPFPVGLSALEIGNGRVRVVGQ